MSELCGGFVGVGWPPPDDSLFRPLHISVLLKRALAIDPRDYLRSILDVLKRLAEDDVFGFDEKATTLVNEKLKSSIALSEVIPVYRRTSRESKRPAAVAITRFRSSSSSRRSRAARSRLSFSDMRSQPATYTQLRSSASSAMSCPNEICS
jgi:hypothetical protein